MHVIRLHWSFYECLNVYSQSCSNSHFSHANYTCTCILCAFILTCISLNKNKSSKNYFKFSIHIHVPHFVNNVKHLIYPYFWQHCWQLDESPPNSFLLLPRHHKSIGTHKFKFETIRNSEPFKVFNISFFLHLYSIKSVDIRIKTKPMYLMNKNSATQASSSSRFIWRSQSTIFSHNDHVNLESISFCSFCCQAKVKSVPSVIFHNDQRSSCLIQMESIYLFSLMLRMLFL